MASGDFAAKMSEIRASKRQRVDALPRPAASSTSLYAPFRALGLISNAIPFALQSFTGKGQLKPVYQYLTCLNATSWALWAEESIQLKFVGDLPKSASGAISSLAAEGDSVYAAAGNAVYRYVRGKLAGQLQVQDSKVHLGQILVLGTQILVLDSAGTQLFIWDKDTEGSSIHHPALSRFNSLL